MCAIAAPRPRALPRPVRIAQKVSMHNGLPRLPLVPNGSGEAIVQIDCLRLLFPGRAHGRVASIARVPAALLKVPARVDH